MNKIPITSVYMLLSIYGAINGVTILISGEHEEKLDFFFSNK